MRVSKETAVLLKDAGYIIRMKDTNGDEFDDDTCYIPPLRESAYTPTLHEASDWLRSKGVHVGVECSDGIWACSGQKCPDGGMLFDLPFCYPTHDSAYEAGIVHGLKYIIH